MFKSKETRKELELSERFSRREAVQKDRLGIRSGATGRC
jgi:hypothetical protein